MALEHRFYGESSPFDSLATGYLDLFDVKTCAARFGAVSTVVCCKTESDRCRVLPRLLVSWELRSVVSLGVPRPDRGLLVCLWPGARPRNRPDFGLKVWEAMSTTKFNTQDDEPANSSFSKESSVGRHSAESDTTLKTLHMFRAGIL